MSNSIRLALPFIDAAQSQKHVTHNEAIVALDALVHLAVKARNVQAPPASPLDGDRYLVPSGATGGFAGHANAIAAFDDGGWAFLSPKAGWRVYVEGEGLFLLFDGAAWKDVGLSLQSLQNLSRLGVGATADAANPVLAKLNGALFTARATSEGGTGDLRLALNKSVAGNTVSQVYQTAYSGRAETGLTGDDRFRIKVSADGTTWRDALSVDPATGLIALPQTAGVANGLATLDASGKVPATQLPASAGGGLASFRNRLRNASFLVNQRAVSGTVTLAAGAYGHDGVKAGAGGCSYTFAQSGVDVTITIASGTLIMAIEDKAIEGGVHRLSHAGTAQARVWQGTGYTGSGSYAATPFTTASLTANTQTNVEFSTGTVLRPQLEPGAVETAFERRPYALELAICQRYYETSYEPGVSAGAPNSTTMSSRVAEATVAYASIQVHFKATKRASPTITLYSPVTGVSGKIYDYGAPGDVSALASFPTTGAFLPVVNGVSVGAAHTIGVSWVASAEL